MEQKRIPWFGFGAITILATVFALALCVKEWSGVAFLYAIFMIWAELALFLGLCFVERAAVKTEQVVFRASYYVILLVYSGAVFLLTLMFFLHGMHGLPLFLTLQLLFMAVAALFLLGFYYISRGIRRSNLGTGRAVAQLDSFVSRFRLLAESDQAGEYAATFQKLADELRFTDASVMTEADQKIEQVLSEVEVEFTNQSEGQPAEWISGKLRELHSLVAKRKIETQAVQKGKI